MFPHINTRWALFYLESHFCLNYDVYAGLWERFGECERINLMLKSSPSSQSKYMIVYNNISYFYTWLANLGGFMISDIKTRNSFTFPRLGCSGTSVHLEMPYSDVIKEMERDLSLWVAEKLFLHGCSEDYLLASLRSWLFCLKLGIMKQWKALIK